MTGNSYVIYLCPSLRVCVRTRMCKGWRLGRALVCACVCLSLCVCVRLCTFLRLHVNGVVDMGVLESVCACMCVNECVWGWRHFYTPFRAHARVLCVLVSVCFMWGCDFPSQIFMSRQLLAFISHLPGHTYILWIPRYTHFISLVMWYLHLHSNHKTTAWLCTPSQRSW